MCPASAGGREATKAAAQSHQRKGGDVDRADPALGFRPLVAERSLKRARRIVAAASLVAQLVAFPLLVENADVPVEAALLLDRR